MYIQRKNINGLSLLFVLGIFSSVLSQNKIPDNQSFRLTGIVNGDDSGYICLNYGDVKDSVIIIDHKFEFKGSVERPTEGWLRLKKLGAFMFPLYIENSNIDIVADFSWNNITVRGSHSALIQKEYNDFYLANVEKENFDSLLFNKLKNFLKANRAHPLSGSILAELAMTKPILTKHQFMELYSLIDKAMQDKRNLAMFDLGMTLLDESAKENSK